MLNNIYSYLEVIFSIIFKISVSVALCKCYTTYETLQEQSIYMSASHKKTEVYSYKRKNTYSLKPYKIFCYSL